MLISLSGTPTSFVFSSSLQYGEGDGTPLYLSMFSPSRFWLILHRPSCMWMVPLGKQI